MSSSVRSRASSSSEAGVGGETRVGVDDLEGGLAGQARPAHGRGAATPASGRCGPSARCSSSCPRRAGRGRPRPARTRRSTPPAPRPAGSAAVLAVGRHQPARDAWAPRPTRPRSWCSWAMPKRSASRIDHHRRVRDVDADLDHGGGDEHVELAGAEARPSSPPSRPTASARAAARAAARPARRSTGGRTSPRPRPPRASRSPRSAGTRRRPGGRRPPRRARPPTPPPPAAARRPSG